jgi:hypothetical protein
MDTIGRVPPRRLARFRSRLKESRCGNSGDHLGASRRIAVIASLAAVVGDISCQPGQPEEAEKPTDTCDQGSGSTVRDAAQNATAEQVEAMKPALVAVLGHEQYQNGYYSDFKGSFDKYWGAFKFLQRPSLGNHEFYDNHGQTGVRGLGYFDYYNGLERNANGSEVDDTVTNPTTGVVVSQPAPQQEGQAGQFGQTGNGWYSYDLGAWHLISPNIECADEPGGCGPTGSRYRSAASRPGRWGSPSPTRSPRCSPRAAAWHRHLQRAARLLNAATWAGTRRPHAPIRLAGTAAAPTGNSGVSPTCGSGCGPDRSSCRRLARC